MWVCHVRNREEKIKLKRIVQCAVRSSNVASDFWFVSTFLGSIFFVGLRWCFRGCCYLLSLNTNNNNNNKVKQQSHHQYPDDGAVEFPSNESQSVSNVCVSLTWMSYVCIIGNVDLSSLYVCFGVWQRERESISGFNAVWTMPNNFLCNLNTHTQQHLSNRCNMLSLQCKM